MTKTLSLRAGDIPRFSIGIESLLNDMLRIENQQHSYPPHNIIKQSETKTRVELAVAGFMKSEISVTTKDSILTITGKKERESTETFIWKGIATRDFERHFQLGEFVEVVEAGIIDGILMIDLEQKIPEENLPKRIAIQ